MKLLVYLSLYLFIANCGGGSGGDEIQDADATTLTVSNPDFSIRVHNKTGKSLSFLLTNGTNFYAVGSKTVTNDSDDISNFKSDGMNIYTSFLDITVDSQTQRFHIYSDPSHNNNGRVGMMGIENTGSDFSSYYYKVQAYNKGQTYTHNNFDLSYIKHFNIVICDTEAKCLCTDADRTTVPDNLKAEGYSKINWCLNTISS